MERKEYDRLLTTSVNLYSGLKKTGDSLVNEVGNQDIPEEEVLDLVKRIRMISPRIYIKKHQQDIRQWAKLSYLYLKTKGIDSLMEINFPKALIEDLVIVEGKEEEEIKIEYLN